MGYPTEMVEKVYAYPELDLNNLYGVTEKEGSTNHAMERGEVINSENNNIEESDVLKDKKKE
jgi:hypothetical protein